MYWDFRRQERTRISSADNVNYFLGLLMECYVEMRKQEDTKTAFAPKDPAVHQLLQHERQYTQGSVPAPIYATLCIARNQVNVSHMLFFLTELADLARRNSETS